MRKLILLFFLINWYFIPIQAQFRYEKCGSDLLLEKSMEASPEVRENRQKIEAFTRAWIDRSGQSATARDVITIPVVVHVLWHEASQNISTLQILSQIGILNEDFRMLNDNVEDVPEEFKALAADVGIEFCMASIDPFGNPTDGIVRQQTTYSCIGDFNTNTNFGTPRLFYSNFGGSDTWDPKSYLNIWVAPTCNAFLGFGFYPGQSVNPEEDGIVINTQHFGNVCNDGRQHHLGRTATHEVGHYFNLNHIWGKRGCGEEDDGVADTPFQDKSNNGCPTHPSNTCGSNDLFMNFMDYSDDACISMFTKGQKLRMLATLNGPRVGLTTSIGCSLNNTRPKGLEVIVFPNPTKDCIHVDFNANFDGMVTVSLFDAGGRLYYETQNNASNIRSIDAKNLSEGLYFLHISNTITTVIKRVYIQN